MHTRFFNWTGRGEDAVLIYRGYELLIRINPRTKHVDGYINGDITNMHGINNAMGLDGLAMMLQYHIDRRADDMLFKFHEGDRVRALCDDGVVRANGVVSMRRYSPECGDKEATYVLKFASGQFLCTQSNVNFY